MKHPPLLRPDSARGMDKRASKIMLPGDDVTVATRRGIERRRRWYKPDRCSICLRLIWSRPNALKEPVGAPEPRQEWVLCKPCYKALIVEIYHSSIQSPARLRIAMGLVAAGRSPRAYSRRRDVSTGEWEFQRDFKYVMWFLVLFTLFHAVIFVILFVIPR